MRELSVIGHWADHRDRLLKGREMPREQVESVLHKAAPRDCHRRGHGTGSEAPMRRKPNRQTTCPVCGTTFWNPKHPRHRFCSRKCSAVARPTTPWQERFWRFVTPAGPDECWEWQGAIGGNGYGSLKLPGGTTHRTHRASWEIHNGSIPEGLQVLHKCDNRPCCNPAHLFLGTHDDNMADMARKGRVVAHSGDNHWRRRKSAISARPAPEEDA